MKCKILSPFLLAVTLLVVPAFASAATLSLTPASDTYSVGKNFTLFVRVSSTDQAMNAASGVVQFPSNLLQVVALSKTPTIMSMWVQEPSYSNSAGTVNFEGVVLNPGFIGSSGSVIGITFRAMSEGTGTISITNGSVLANDGSGTEILAGASGASFAITPAPPPPPPPTPKTAPDDTKTPQPPPAPPEEEVIATTDVPVEVPAQERSLLGHILDFLAHPAVSAAFAGALAFALGIISARLLRGGPQHSSNLREALRDVDVEVHKAFLTLRDHINRALEDLEKESENRELTAAEKRFVHEMTTTIKEAEKTVSSDIKSAGK